MKHCATCTCCTTVAKLALDLAEDCERLNIHVRYGGLISEAGTAQLMGYSSPDTLRKQVTESRNLLDFTRRGNRRYYRLDDIAAYLLKN